MYRTHADDLASGDGDFSDNAAPLEFANRLPRAEELASKVHANHHVPLSEGHVFKRSVLLEPCVVHQDIYGSEFCEHLSEHCLDLRFLRYIGLDRKGADPVAGNDLHDFLGRRIVSNVVHDYVGAGFPKGDGDRFADSRVGPRYQRLLSLENLRHAAIGCDWLWKIDVFGFCFHGCAPEQNSILSTRIQGYERSSVHVKLHGQPSALRFGLVDPYVPLRPSRSTRSAAPCQFLRMPVAAAKIAIMIASACLGVGAF